MPVQFVEGDIFETGPDIGLAHGCNCAGAMSKGIAVEFKRRWPEMYNCYKTRCKNGEFNCGDVFVWKDETSGRTVFNLGTQKSWRSKATLESVDSALQAMADIAEELEVQVVCTPLIGGGLGGLSLDDVKNTFNRVFSTRNLSVVVCEKFVAGKRPITGDV